MAAAATLSRLRGSKEAKSVDELEADMTAEGHAAMRHHQQVRDSKLYRLQ